MSAGEITAIVIAVAVILVLLVAALLLWQQLRTKRLREQFGPEYDRTLDERGGRRQAEQELRGREKRHDELKIRPLSTASRRQYTQSWTDIQAQFVDQPAQAVAEADRLVSALMTERGYPGEHYRQRLADLSVEHASTLEHYRVAHEINVRSTRRQASTEDLRGAMVHYRALFDELLGGNGSTGRSTGQPQGRAARRE